jgi:Tfp pilus assembly protein PilX
VHVIRRLLHRLARDESGVALVMALSIMMVMAVTTAGILIAGTANQREAYVSDNARQAFAIAQEGLADAEGMVYNAAANHTTPPSGSQTITDLPVGSGTFYASVGGDNVTWTMTGTGTVNGVTRVVSAQANVPTPVTSEETAVWNYLYSDAGGCTTMNGSVTVAVPILIRGSLCLGGSFNFTGATLETGGDISVTGSAKIGSSGHPIQALKVGLSSSGTNTCQGVAPGTGACNGSTSPIYASSVSEGVDTVPTMPCIGQPSSWDVACTGTNDGTWSTLHTKYTYQASLPKSGCPANLFDNNSTLDNSDTSISSVMFGSSYDCTIGSSSSPCVNDPTAIPAQYQAVCEIKWTSSTKTLYVNGEFYFDGTLTIQGNTTYTGLASFYFTGGVNTTGSPTFCAASAKSGNTTCTSAWDTTQDVIVMTTACWANSTGSTLTTSGCVNLGGNSVVQIGFYCVTNYLTAGGASNMGPVLSNNLALGGGAQTLIPLHYFPPGTPLENQTVYLPASKPINWSG